MCCLVTVFLFNQSENTADVDQFVVKCVNDEHFCFQANPY